MPWLFAGDAAGVLEYWGAPMGVVTESGDDEVIWSVTLKSYLRTKLK